MSSSFTACKCGKISDDVIKKQTKRKERFLIMAQEHFAKQLEQMKNVKGFIAALDQSGGSTPKALASYGVAEDTYNGEDEMFDAVHEMRTRIIKSPSFDANYIIGAILFEQTMDRKIDGQYTSDYLWNEKNVVPFVKVDKGLADLENGAQLMKPMPELDALLDRAVERNVFGTKMRSRIESYDEKGIADIVAQQFEVGKQIADKHLVPILEPEVDINAEDKAKIEAKMLEEINKHMENWPTGVPVMFKLTIPTEANLYKDLMAHEDVVRVVALSGGYSRDHANELLALNEGLIGSFSRAFSQGLTFQQTAEEFDATMAESVKSIAEASSK